MEKFLIEELVYTSPKKSLSVIFLILIKKYKLFEKKLFNHFIFQKIKFEILTFFFLYVEINFEFDIIRQLLKAIENRLVKIPFSIKSFSKIFRLKNFEYRKTKLIIGFLYRNNSNLNFLNIENSLKKKKLPNSQKNYSNFRILIFFSNIILKIKLLSYFSIYFFEKFFFDFDVIKTRYLKIRRPILIQSHVLKTKYKYMKLEKNSIFFHNGNLKIYLMFLKLKPFFSGKKIYDLKNRKYKKKILKICNLETLCSIPIFSSTLSYGKYLMNPIFDIFYGKSNESFYSFNIILYRFLEITLIKPLKNFNSFLIKKVSKKKQQKINKINIRIFYKSTILSSYFGLIENIKVRLLYYCIFLHT
jgi:hypothetical protein